jgi:protein gp37
MRRPKRISSISWCTKSWNPWQGCIKVSPGCKFCYMYRDKARYGQDPAHVVRSKTTFAAPLKWTAPQLVFSCSWSDFFLEEADEWRGEAWDVIRRTSQHTYLLLTKRPERLADHLSQGWPWPHVWLGVSIETPAYRWRADRLRQIPAAHRFLSCEPLLEDLGTMIGVLRPERSSLSNRIVLFGMASVDGCQMISGHMTGRRCNGTPE